VPPHLSDQTIISLFVSASITANEETVAWTARHGAFLTEARRSFSSVIRRDNTYPSGAKTISSTDSQITLFVFGKTQTLSIQTFATASPPYQLEAGVFTTPKVVNPSNKSIGWHLPNTQKDRQGDTQRTYNRTLKTGERLKRFNKDTQQRENRRRLDELETTKSGKRRNNSLRSCKGKKTVKLWEVAQGANRRSKQESRQDLY